MQRFYKLPFVQFVKKAGKPLPLAIEDAVEVVCGAPLLGEPKVGDLVGIRVYKFRFNRQEYLMAYQLADDGDPAIFLAIEFYQVGSHEKFYESLKKYLRAAKK